MPPEHERTPNCEHNHTHAHAFTHDHTHNNTLNNSHAHDHGPAHGPAHEQRHDHTADDKRTESFHLSFDEHEGALIASVLLERSGNYQEADELLSKQLKGLSDWVEGSGGFVGHIKASLILEECSQSYSITSGVVQSTKQDSGAYRIGLVTIVFGISEHNLTEFLKTLLG